MKTAIIMFVYNRPEHTKKVLEGLKNNNVRKLYIFADGIKKDEHEEDVLKTRSIIEEINWCDVKVEYSVKNRGLASSVIYGVSKVFKLGYDRVIVVEDDCIPKEDFIDYMDKSFDFYENSDKVMHISGFGLPLKQKINKSNYITSYPCSWGWGTWKKYWENCNFNDIEGYNSLLSNNEEVKKFNKSGSAFSEFLEMQLKGNVNSWLIRWYYHIYVSGGVCTWKTNTSIINEGFDGTGVHKVKFDRFNQKATELDIEFEFEESNEEKNNINKEFKRYFINKSFSERLKTIIYMYTGIILR